jgi:acid phosphatase type 7
LSTPPPHTYAVKKVSSDSWGETTITWNNKPAPDAASVTTFSSATNGTWLEIDITSIAQANSTVSLAIVPNSTSTDGVDFSSRNAGSNQPQVVIDAGGTTTTAGAGGAGATGGTGGTGGGSTVPTDPNLKIAFVGDTADGTNWGNVLSLIQAEGAPPSPWKAT